MNYKITMYFKNTNMENIHYDGNDVREAAEWWNSDTESLNGMIGMHTFTEIRAYQDGKHVSSYDPTNKQIIHPQEA